MILSQILAKYFPLICHLSPYIGKSFHYQMFIYGSRFSLVPGKTPRVSIRGTKSFYVRDQRQSGAGGRLKLFSESVTSRKAFIYYMFWMIWWQMADIWMKIDEIKIWR